MRSLNLMMLFGASTLAAQLNERFIEDFNPLMRRQQFKPTTTTAEGSTCADAFGEGYVTCRESREGVNRLCYNPNMGQTCCTNTWACPSGSFCLASGSCCPNNQSPQSCASQNGISISSDFQVPTSTPIAGGNSSSYSSSSNNPSQSSSSQKASSGSQSYQVGIMGAGLASVLLGAAVVLL